MLGTNLTLQGNLTQLLMPASGMTQNPVASTAAPEAAPSPSTDFEQLLQGLFPVESSNESALPELLAVVASLAGSSSLFEGIQNPVGSAETPKDKMSPKGQNPAEGNPLAALQGLLGIAPQICSPPATAVTSEESKTPQDKPSIVALTAELPDLQPETAKPDSPEKRVLNLKDFDVRRFELKTELEIAPVQPKLIRITAFPGLVPRQSKPDLTELKPGKDSAEAVDSTAATPPVFGGKHETPLIKAPEAVQRVHVAIDPPPPPPVARQISMDIGDPESQVRVVLRERNGDLAVQFGAATERLRENLQHAAPLLMHELRRDNPHTVSLDFSRFGTATEGGHESHQDSPRRKALKPEAVFADVDETAYLTGDAPSANSF